MSAARAALGTQRAQLIPVSRRTPRAGALAEPTTADTAIEAVNMALAGVWKALFRSSAPINATEMIATIQSDSQRTRMATFRKNKLQILNIG